MRLRPKLLIITGTPGTGKSTLAKFLAQKLKWERLDISTHYSTLTTNYNHPKHCYDVDIEKFRSLVREKLMLMREKLVVNGKSSKATKSGLIVDTHIAHYLPPRMVDLCIVLTCSDLKELHRRLKKRKYAQKKIQENVQAEIFQVCLEEAKARGHTVVVFDTSGGILYQKILSTVKRQLYPT